MRGVAIPHCNEPLTRSSTIRYAVTDLLAKGQRMQFGQMKRREFVTALGGAVVWPIVARAQQGQRMPRIGALMNLAADDPVSIARAKAFVEGLQALGWTNDRNVHLDYRWAEGKPDLFQRYASELVALASQPHRLCVWSTVLLGRRLLVPGLGL